MTGEVKNNNWTVVPLRLRSARPRNTRRCVTLFLGSVKTERVAPLTLVLDKDSKSPPSLEFGFLVLVTALFAFQPEDEPIDIPLLRGQSFPRLHEQVCPVRQKDQFDWFFLFRQPSVPFPGRQVPKLRRVGAF